MNWMLKRLLLYLLVFVTVMVHLSIETAEALGQLAVGDKAPNFELPIVGSDDFLRFADEYPQGAVVVVVLRGYPGYQCPLCSQQFSGLVNRATALGKLAHRVVVVYPGAADSLQRNSEQFLGSRRVPEPIVLVRDDSMEMVSQWGLRWNARRETAYPATFVITKSGRVTWMKVSQSHAQRSTVEEIVRELRKL